MSEVQSMIVAIDQPRDDDGNRIGEDFYIELDLSNHVFEPLPDEFK